MKFIRILVRDASRLTVFVLLLISTVIPVELSATTFTSPKTYPVGSTPTGVAVGDFNGDGKEDLVVANFKGGTVSVLLGKGGGTLQPAVNYNAGNSPTYIAVGDLNGDGKLDLAVANSASQTVSILLGNGNGTFQQAEHYAAGGAASFVAVADFNHDGKSDLLVSNAQGMISVLLGKGDGRFDAPVVTSTQAKASIVALGDFNRDGRIDVATAFDKGNIELFNGGLLVFLGKGDGTFQTPKSLPIPDVFRPTVVTAADLNHDGKLDLALTAFTGTFIFLGHGDGKFSLLPNPENTVHGPYGFAAHAVSFADLNHDGNLDLVTINTDFAFGIGNSQNVIEWGLGNGKGTFGGELVNDNPCTQSRFCILLPDVPGSLLVTDLNGDNAPDLVVANQNVIYTTTLANNVGVYLNRGGTFVKLTSSVDPSLAGHSVTFTSIVTAGVAGSGTPTGTVTFRDRAVTLGTVTLVSGKGSLTTSGLSVGQHSIKAFYSGNSTFNRNSSVSLKQVVNSQ